MSDEPQIPQPRWEKPGFWKSFRSAFFFVFLVGVFLVTYQLSTTYELPSAPVVIASALGLFVVLAVVTIAINTRQIRRFMRDNNDAIAMLARGELQRAHEMFWRWSEDATVPGVAALARHNLGWTLIREGKLQQAVAVLIDNDKQREKPLRSSAMYPTSATDIALVLALLGDTTEAEAWLARADERAAGPKQPSFAAMALYARAVLDCRSGRTADAARILDEHWAETEAVLTGENIRPLRVVRAFAHAAAGPRSAGVAEQLIASTRPVYAGEYTFLGKAWPEMQQFLAANQLG